MCRGMEIKWGKEGEERVKTRRKIFRRMKEEEEGVWGRKRRSVCRVIIEPWTVTEQPVSTRRKTRTYLFVFNQWTYDQNILPAVTFNNKKRKQS